MKKNIFLVLSLSFLLLLSISVPAQAEETKTKSEQRPFTLEVTNNLINLQANKASFKEILSDLEKKTELLSNLVYGKLIQAAA